MDQKSPSSSAGGADVAKLRRHVRILVDLGRLAGATMPLDSFLDQACVQVARAVEIDHVKVLRYRRSTADLFMEAGMGWKEGVVRSATFPADLRSPPGRSYQTGEPLVIADAGAAEAAGDYVISDVLKEHGIVSIANVPLLHKVQHLLDVRMANRINAISLAHDQLSPRIDVHAVDVAGYLRALCASIEAQVENVAVEVEADGNRTRDRAGLPLGLIVNEAATNSVKHAFGPEGGQQALARQIGGEIEQESSDRGTTTSVTFPVMA